MGSSIREDVLYQIGGFLHIVYTALDPPLSFLHNNLVDVSQKHFSLSLHLVLARPRVGRVKIYIVKVIQFLLSGVTL